MKMPRYVKAVYEFGQQANSLAFCKATSVVSFLLFRLAVAQIRSNAQHRLGFQRLRAKIKNSVKNKIGQVKFNDAAQI